MADDSDSSVPSEPEVEVVYTLDEILQSGLELLYTKGRIKRAKKKRNMERFHGHYGCSPRIVALVMEELQRTTIAAAKVEPAHLHLDYFLMSMYHLKRYPTELERESRFDIDCSKSRKWIWYYLRKVQALKLIKIVWPADDFGEDTWVVTVDGTHCLTCEPHHPVYSQDKKFYSHKFGKAGLNYELAIAIASNRLVWMNGPFRAGLADLPTFTGKGLKDKLEAAGKRAIGDGGYGGHPQVISTPNNMDTKAVKKFKSRALKRHETFNGMTKTYECLSGRFRHEQHLFKVCFEAICVICQYKIENESPLFEVLIPGLGD